MNVKYALAQYSTTYFRTIYKDYISSSVIFFSVFLQKSPHLQALEQHNDRRTPVHASFRSNCTGECIRKFLIASTLLTLALALSAEALGILHHSTSHFLLVSAPQGKIRKHFHIMVWQIARLIWRFFVSCAGGSASKFFFCFRNAAGHSLLIRTSTVSLLYSCQAKASAFASTLLSGEPSSPRCLKQPRGTTIGGLPC